MPQAVLYNDLITRLKGRRDQSLNTCVASLRNGLKAEALLHKSRSEAYQMAMDDVAWILKEHGIGPTMEGGE